MTNFDFLKKEPKFDVFSGAAISAEKCLAIDATSCIMNCRRAMELAIKWLYTVDSSLYLPNCETEALSSLMMAPCFKKLLDKTLQDRLHFIRKMGNNAAHADSKVTDAMAILCLQNLFEFLEYINYCYAGDHEKRRYDNKLLMQQANQAALAEQQKKELEAEIKNLKLQLEKETSENERHKKEKELEYNKLAEENKSLREELTARRIENSKTYQPVPIDLSEYDTRKIYIDVMLSDAGWTRGSDWIDEVKLQGMPNKSSEGFADYVLYDDAHIPLAVVEAKRTSRNIEEGRRQAVLYADLLEKQYHRRPCIFLTNGFETRIIDGTYPERKVASVYSKADLEKLISIRSRKSSLGNVTIDKNTAGRYYQIAAIKSVCSAFDHYNKRKALLVMATGSGKTRTVVELCRVLINAGWVHNVLFLADRTSLVLQAKRAFVSLYKSLTVTNLCEDRDNYNARVVFSTYQTMINSIDSVLENGKKLYSCGHFDLVICDEAHRSIYNKYRDIFTYFDAPLVGLTATPKNEIDKNTYEIFELEPGVPTYAYDLAQAVKDGFLIDFQYVESRLKFMETGITYDELSDEDKQLYEETFAEDGDVPDCISSSEMNEKIFNRDTISKVLAIVMDNGLKIDYAQKIGKTIIFAKNHRHAEKILEVFNEDYPHLTGYAEVIDNSINYAQSLIDDFSDPRKKPQIAISVDMLDTGIDIPEILNLVFFKKVMSYAKFWQMIGRGTRLCPNLIDGADKGIFYIFDFCGNFEFFKAGKGREVPTRGSLQSALFNLQFEMAFKLQQLEYQEPELIDFRNSLIEIMVAKVKKLPHGNFAVKQHIRFVDRYGIPDSYQSITQNDLVDVRNELAPLILPEDDDASALRFDALIYGIELALMIGKKYGRGRGDLLKKVRAVADVANIPEIAREGELITKILHTDYVDHCGIRDFEQIRERLRDLMKYISKEQRHYDTNFEDQILNPDFEWGKSSDLKTCSFKNYRAKAEYYIREHSECDAIIKLRCNLPLNSEDVEELEQILWSESGTREEYEQECGSESLGEFVRGIVGLDMHTAKAAFAEFLENKNLDSRQIYFVNQIVEYIVQNGMMKDLSVLQDAPFTDYGSIVEVFSDLTVWSGIKNVIDGINANASTPEIDLSMPDNVRHYSTVKSPE